MILFSLAGFIQSHSPDSIPNGLGVLIIDGISSSGGGGENSVQQSRSDDMTNLLSSICKTAECVPNLNIEQLRSLPLLDYKLIIFRDHSGPDAIVTNDGYTSISHVLEQFKDEVGVMAVAPGTLNFTVRPSFITNEMVGAFRHRPVIIFEGCATLEGAGFAKAFVEKGASAFAGWNAGVTLYHADNVTARMLNKLIYGKETLGNSIVESMSEVGPDPVTEATLSYYPPSATSIIFDKS